MSLKNIIKAFEESMADALKSGPLAALAGEYNHRLPVADPALMHVFGTCIGRLTRLGADPVVLGSYVAVSSQMVRDALPNEAEEMHGRAMALFARWRAMGQNGLDETVVGIGFLVPERIADMGTHVLVVADEDFAAYIERTWTRDDHRDINPAPGRVCVVLAVA